MSLVGTVEVRCIQCSGGDTWRTKTAGRPSYEWDVEVKMNLREVVELEASVCRSRQVAGVVNRVVGFRGGIY